MVNLFNAQDAFAKLVEDIRIGLVGRPVAVFNPIGTRFVPHRPNISLDDLPVFHMIGEHHRVPPIGDVLDQIAHREFHLPYPRCAFMMSLPGSHPGLQHLTPRMRVRHSYIVVAEEDDDHLHFVPFMQNELIPHWVRQLFDIYIPFGRLAEITVSYDPAWGEFPAEFIASVEMSLWNRLQGILNFVHRLMARPGNANAIPGSSVTDKINARRGKMALPPIQQVIAIDLDIPEPMISVGLGAGSPKRPHFRKGSWHTRKATGKRSWHPPVKVHGGGAIMPPWYEVR